jgi:hypothetical protein
VPDFNSNTSTLLNFTTGIFGPVSLANTALYNLSSEKNTSVGNSLDALATLQTNSLLINNSSFSINIATAKAQTVLLNTQA